LLFQTGLDVDFPPHADHEAVAGHGATGKGLYPLGTLGQLLDLLPEGDVW